MHSKRSSLVVAAVFAAASFASVSAHAQSASDTVAGAPAITATPFSAVTDVSGATTTPDEPQPCSGSGEGSVWYRFTATSNVELAADTLGSSYDTVLSVWDGAPGGTLVGCNDDYENLQSLVRFSAVAGHTYYFQVANWASVTPGSSLRFNLGPPPPPFESEVTIDPAGRAAGSTGVIEVGGTLRCNRPGDASLVVFVQQQTARRATTGVLQVQGACNVAASRWSARIVGSNARFTPGPVTVMVVGSARSLQNWRDYASVNVAGSVRLQGTGSKDLSLPPAPAPL